jgi:hypothetical protein
VLAPQPGGTEHAEAHPSVRSAAQGQPTTPLEGGWRCLRWHVNRELWQHRGGKLVEVRKGGEWAARIVKVTAWRPVKCLAEALEMEP